MNTRKKFIANSSILILGGMALQSFSKNKYLLAASDQINIGAIGINGMGWSDTLSLLKNPGVNLIAVCDVDSNVIKDKLSELSKKNYDTSKIKIYSDYRQLLDQKDIDAVVIGSPDHWHALMMIHAVEAGKDVYVEKPIGNSIVECNQMVAAQKKFNRVVQVGQWQRSSSHFKEAIDFIKTGQLGSIRNVKAWQYALNLKPGIMEPNGNPPPGVDYKMWLGPAKSGPFNPNRFHFNFRWFWDYAGGLMTDWGVHLLDYALLGMGSPSPKSVVAIGGRFAFPDHAQETPDTMTALYEFDGFNLTWEHTMGMSNGFFNQSHGIAFMGTNGTLELDRGGWQVKEEKKGIKIEVPRKPSTDSGLDKHTKNFLDVIRSKKLENLNCPIQAGANVAIFSQLGNIAYKSKQRINWDSNNKIITDSKINEQYLEAQYHNGYKLPKY